MDKNWREWAKGMFGLYQQEFDATLVFEDENFFIMDWRDKNGSGNLSTRYIVDKKKGDLIIKGDAGLVVLVLRHIADEVERNNPGAKELYEGMKKCVNAPTLSEIEKIKKATEV